MAKKKPAHTIRIGRIEIAIWANDNGSGQTLHNTTITRSYKDGDVWKDTNSFRPEDLPIVSKVADFAYAWIQEQRATGSRRRR
jgi:hypothetical protein